MDLDAVLGATDCAFFAAGAVFCKSEMLLAIIRRYQAPLTFSQRWENARSVIACALEASKLLFK
jgi:hypothetical protein